MMTKKVTDTVNEVTIGSFPYEVKKSNQIIRSKYSLNTLDQKILFLALAKVKYDADEKEPIANISVSEVKSFLNLKGHSIYDRVKNSATTLGSMQILKEDRENDSFDLITLIRTVSYRNGNMTVYFNKDIKDLVCNIAKNFTTFKLEIYMGLSDNYVLRLYEMLKSEAFKGDIVNIEMSLGNLQLSTGLISLSKEMSIALQGPSVNMDKVIEKHAKDILDWRTIKRMTENAVEEINEKTDIYVEYKPVRKGRGGRIEGIMFTVKEKENTIKEEIEEEIDLDDLIDEIKDIFTEKISTKDCKALLKEAKNDVRKIEEKYNLMKQSNNIKDTMSWMIMAIREDYKKDESVKKEKKPIKKKNAFNNFGQREYGERFMQLLEKSKLVGLVEDERKELEELRKEANNI